MQFPLRSAGGEPITINEKKEVYIELNGSKQFLGLLHDRVDGRKVFIRPNLKDREHLFRKTQSYALDSKLVEALAVDKAVIFFETDSGKYYTTADYMLEKGTVAQYRPYNRQVFLERVLFSKAMA